MSSYIGNFSDKFGSFDQIFVPLSIGIILSFITCLFVMYSCKIKIERQFFPVILGSCVAGSLPGFFAGYSREAIAGTTLAALIGIVSTLLAFSMNKDSESLFRPIAPVASMGLLFSALVGYFVGEDAKGEWIVYNEAIIDRRSEYDRVWIEVEKARQLANLEILKRNRSEPITIQELTAANHQYTSGEPSN